MDSYTLSFVTMEIILISIVLILALRMNKNIGTFSEIRHFQNIQTTFVVGAVTEIIWALQNASVIQLSVWQAWLMNGISLTSFSLLLYEWFRFIAHRVLRLEDDKMVLTSMKVQTAVIIIDVLITSTSFLTGFIYKIDANGLYTRGTLYAIHSLFCYSHWVWTTIIIVHYLRKRGLKEREQLYNLLIVSLFPFFGGLLCIVNNSVPFLDASIMLGTLLTFIHLQEEQITTDALTGLNNRSDFVKMYDKMLNVADVQPFVMLVADIDKFKHINDVYGHLAGDHALLLVANGLRKIGSQHPSMYICRYGGDEFVMLASCKDIRNPSAFADIVNRTLREETRKAQLGFEVTFSVGYHKIDNRYMNLKDSFGKADMMLYEVKRNKR